MLILKLFFCALNSVSSVVISFINIVCLFKFFSQMLGSTSLFAFAFVNIFLPTYSVTYYL